MHSRRPIDPHEALCNSALVRKDSALVLNSRQSKNPVGADLWVRKTVEAVRAAVDAGFPVIASIGMNTWELVLWAVGECGGGAIVLCPVPSDESPERMVVETAADFGLDPEMQAWLFVEGDTKARGGKAWWDARDMAAFGLASRLIPVSIRSGGRLDSLLRREAEEGRKIDRRFHTPYVKKTRRGSGINMPLDCFCIDEWDRLTHWTSRSNGPWPGERSCDYYRDIVASGDVYLRSAYHTLERILKEKLLRASGNHIRGGVPVVAFTALQPWDTLPLMRWRRRYLRPTFEPYGVAIRYPTALKIGLRPVTYVESFLKGKELPHLEPGLVQGYGEGDWRAEKEWRAIGDVDLSKIPAEEMLILVPSEEEAEELSRLTDFRVHPLCRSVE